jgi:hypothetical protein
VGRDNVFAYDHFLSLVSVHGITSPLVRKVMFFVWAYRDERIRRFFCERVADRFGKWRVRELLNKSNFVFFEKEGWLKSAAARKARSNIEFFLGEVGLFDAEAEEVHLELDDGWLYEAATVAAQHEDDPRQRRRLLNDPAQFLIVNGWQGLANTTKAELLDMGAPPVEDVIPLEDETITPARLGPSPAKDWNRKKPKQSDKKSTSAYIDLVARERANQSHFLLEELAARAIRSLGLAPKYNEHIDMYFVTPHGTVLAEVKSCDIGNIHSQIRKGISQLFEYRYVYRKILGRNPLLVLIIEAEPIGSKSWLIGYLQSLDIFPIWKDASGRQLVTTSPRHEALKGFVTFRRSP